MSKSVFAFESCSYTSCLYTNPLKYKQSNSKFSFNVKSRRETKIL